MESVDPAYSKAKRHANQLRGLFQPALTYSVAITFLAALNLMTTPARWRIKWIAFGWGIGLVAHGLSVFTFGSVFGQHWEERDIHEYLARRLTNRKLEM